MSCCQKRMTRCECHEVSFQEILRYARILDNDNINYLMEKLGFGQTCTACHCDVKALLGEQTQELAQVELSTTPDRSPFARFS